MHLHGLCGRHVFLGLWGQHTQFLGDVSWVTVLKPSTNRRPKSWGLHWMYVVGFERRGAQGCLGQTSFNRIMLAGHSSSIFILCFCMFFYEFTAWGDSGTLELQHHISRGTVSQDRTQFEAAEKELRPGSDTEPRKGIPEKDANSVPCQSCGI